MILADDSHEISYLIYFENQKRLMQNLLSAAVVIGALRVKLLSPFKLSRLSQSCQLDKSLVLLGSILTLKVPMTTAADDKFCNIFPKFLKMKS